MPIYLGIQSIKMKNINVGDIVKITNGKLITGDTKIICENFSKDTRTIKAADVYVGIKGENFDGNKFWKDALEKGANVAIVEDIEFGNEEIKKYSSKAIIQVENTIIAIGKIAQYKRNMYNIPIIAVTGSVGKTSTKDIIANIISQKYKTLKTEANLNNNIGLPFTLLGLKEHEAAVIEMGMNHFGEIKYLTQIAKPTISVITNIGTSHIGNLGSRENILKAKLEILEGMKNKILIINNDNDLLNKYYEENKNNKEIKIKTYGIENESNIMAEDINIKENYSEFLCKTNDEEFNVTVPVGGKHFVYNALCAATIGKTLNISNEKIQDGIEKFELTKKRMDIETLENGAKIINDSYNASFESMSASLKYLSEFKQNRKIAVLGDMFELGEFSKELHLKVGEEVANNKIDILICSGENARYIVDGAKNSKMNEKKIFYFENKNDIIKFLKEKINITDIVLFKASNGMRFFDLVEELKKGL